MCSSRVIILFAIVTHAYAEEFNPAKAPVNTKGKIKATFDSKVGSPSEITGTRDGDLEASGKFDLGKVGPFSWSLKASGTDFSNPSWPPKMLGRLGSSWETPVGALKGSVESPVAWPMEDSEVSLSLQTKKDLGDFCSTLKCTASPKSWPPTARSITSFKLQKDVAVSGLGDFSCAVETNPDLVTTATIERTLDTNIGPVCCKLQATAEQWPPKNLKPAGSLQLKKNLGNICCNMKMMSSGALQCTFEAASKLTTTDDLAATDQHGTSISIFTMFLISAFVGSGVAFAAFRLRRSTSTASSERLLTA